MRSCKNKTFDVGEMIADHKIDIFVILESWLKENGDEHTINELTPTGFVSESFPRRGGKGGGIAVVFNGQLSPYLKLKNISSSFKTFEAVELTVEMKTRLSFKTIIVYRPPPSPKNKLKTSDFLCELDDMMSSYFVNGKDVIFLGDFNIHFDIDKPETRHVKNLLEEQHMTQHVKTSTQRAGHILDWVVTPKNMIISQVTVIDKCVSDHFLIFFDITTPRWNKNITKTTVTSRNIKKIDTSAFRNDIVQRMTDCTERDCTTPSTVFSALRDVFDIHAPLTSRKVNLRKPSPWFNKDIKSAKRERRRAEAKWKKSGLTIHKDIYIFHKNLVNKLLRKFKSGYYHSKITNAVNSKQFFNLVNELMGKEKRPGLPSASEEDQLAEDFSDFFINKIKKIREGFDKDQDIKEINYFQGKHLEFFREVSCEEVDTIIKSSKNKSCDLDPIPTELLKQNLDVLLPAITQIMNESLRSGTVPSCFKIAMVKPLLKKPGLDLDVLKNYRPVSNLPFLSKILEKIVLRQLMCHLTENNLQECYQSAYRSNHCTETALLRVVSDLNSVIDSGSVTLLNLLDLSAAFDTIDHTILIQRLQTVFGITGTAVRWFESYISDRRQFVSIGKSRSKECVLSFGVPQGSVLGPILFTLYTYPISNIMKIYEIMYHLYADDTQIYDTDLNNDFAVKRKKCEDCIGDVKEWMDKNMLKLNEEKTEVMVVGSKRLRAKVEGNSINVNGCEIDFVDSVKNLGVFLDSELTMESQVSSLRKKLLFELKKISNIRMYISKETCQKLVSSLIFSKLDYCNSLLYGISNDKIKRLQVVQNNAARLVLGKRKSDEATPLLRELHWLPVSYRINYKIATLVFKCIQGYAPTYLQETLKLRQPSRKLRSSSDVLRLEIPRTKLTAGERTFNFSGPHIWNDLPFEIRNAGSLDIFKNKLKTYYFRLHFI